MMNTCHEQYFNCTHAHTVPALMCNNPEFMLGGITARWSYIHTGGRDLTSVLVSYTFQEGSIDSNPIPIPNDDPTITSINVPKLTAGIRYTFNITAVNDIGSSEEICDPTLLNIGKYREICSTCTPKFMLTLCILLYRNTPNTGLWRLSAWIQGHRDQDSD